MLFSSIVFLFYFLPVTLVLYYLLKKWTAAKNAVLLIFSLFFYAWGEPWFVLVMLASIMGNYLLAIWVDRVREYHSRAKFVLFLTVVLNIGLLFVFKYADFFINNINQVAKNQIPNLNLRLPLGISFFTFQALSYVVDVYRKNGALQKNPFYVALYISFFPQLIAGPIVRYSTMDEQIRSREESFDKFSVGTCRFIAGLGKKILLANHFAVIADWVFNSYPLGGCPLTLAWLGSFSYTLQILFDFSGYSDMAIGLGLMFGFKFEENFNYPYISRSIGEFWRRWHISLGAWFKEYIYFPLGGSRVKNMDIVLRNMLIVWLCTGFWHGAEWTFVIWGLLNFACLVFERFTGLENRNGHGIRRWCYTMFVVNIGWVIFRSENLVAAGNYIQCMFGFGQGGIFSDYTWMYLKEYGIFFAAAIFFCIPVGKRFNYLIVNGKAQSRLINMVYPVAMLLLFAVCVTYLVKGSYNPFIYFNF